MNLSERRQFIRSLTNSVKKSLLAQAPKMPANWNGLELRELIADTFDRERFLSTRGHSDRSTNSKRRLKAYEQDVAALGRI